MPAPTTTDELVDLVRRSGLIDPRRLDNVLGQTANDDAQVTPRQVANRLVAAGLITQFQAEQFLLGKWRGFTIGKYKVLERLGFGGNGTVYLCEHLVVKRRVAVKVLPLAKAANPAALGRFYREARASGVLDHPNLVKAHDIDQENGLHFLVMEYVDGTSLQDLITRIGPLPVERAAQYIKQAALGLQAAHGVGLVHRDIKPSNILLDRSGTVKVLDLGLARFYNDESDLLTLKYDDQAVLGTADYVAPEQALNSHGADIRADIYSLGCTFYFLLAGRPPFPGGKAAQKLMMHQTKMPTSIRELRPDVPAALAPVLETMLAKDPAKRYRTPAEVVEVLAPWTATAVAPPAASEMPHLSPAARGDGPDVDPGPATPVFASRPPVRNPATPSRPARKHSPTGVPTAVVSLRKPATLCAIETPAALNADVPTANETRQSPSAASAGARRQPALQPQPAATKAPANRSLRRLGGILIASAIIGVMTRWSMSHWNYAPADSGASGVLVVTASGEPGTHPSIAAALRHARPGDRIEVRAETWEEDLNVQGDNGLGRDVCIEGHNPDGRPVVWRIPKGRDDGRPLLKISGIPGLQVRGFTLDGRDRVRTLIVLAGACPGLTLENLHITGFQQSGVALRNCSGEEKRPVTLQQLRVVPSRGATSGLHFDSRGEEANRWVRITNCRLEGPYEAAVVLSGRTADVELSYNRIFNATDGLLYRKAAPGYPVGMRLASNTFYKLGGVGLHFEVAPPADGSHLELTHNLFGRVEQLAQVEGFAGEAGQLFGESGGNFRDEATTEGVPTLNTPALVFTLPTDPADEATFLRYPAASALAAAGSPGVPPAKRD